MPTGEGAQALVALFPRVTRLILALEVRDHESPV